MLQTIEFVRSVPCIEMDSFLNSPEGWSLYVRCHEAGDMTVYEDAKAAYYAEHPDERASLLPPASSGSKPARRKPMAKWSYHTAVAYARLDEVVRATGIAEEVVTPHIDSECSARYALALAFIAGVAEGKRRERSRRKRNFVETYAPKETVI